VIGDGHDVGFAAADGRQGRCRKDDAHQSQPMTMASRTGYCRRDNGAPDAR
jgi:hypothetical protein